MPLTLVTIIVTLLIPVGIGLFHNPVVGRKISIYNSYVKNLKILGKKLSCVNDNLMWRTVKCQHLRASI